MKIALCLHGLVGTDDKYGHGKKIINYKIGFKHFKERVIDINDKVDVFFHTWSVDQESNLVSTYDPKSYKVEKQPQFSEDPRRQAIFCRWKSTKEVVDLVKNSGENYDFILLTRFDIAMLVDFKFDEYDKDVFYAQGPPGPKKGSLELINDLWFFSNQDNMLQFANLYDHLGEQDYQPHIDSNHELARKHLIKTGLHDCLEYKFKREWTGAHGKLSSDTPLVRWHYLNRV